MAKFESKHTRAVKYRHGLGRGTFDSMDQRGSMMDNAVSCPGCFTKVGLLPDGRLRKHYLSRLVHCLTRWPDGRIQFDVEE